MKSASRVLFVTGGLEGEASGIDRITSALANALARAGTPIVIYAGGCKATGFPPGMLCPPNECRTYPGLWLGGLSPSPRLKAALREAIRSCDVVHNHSLWMLPNHYSSALAHGYGKPVVIALHGTLEPEALRISRWKKWLAGKWFQDRDLWRAACLHLTAPAEARGAREYGLTNPMAMIPNGVELPAIGAEHRAAFFEHYPHLAGKRLCLFLSRLHAKKGLPNLIRAWSRLVPRYRDWHLVIAGPDAGMETKARRMVGELDLGQAVTFTGVVAAERKLEAFSAARLFVLPSHTEGFSMAVLEAMASRLPVLITHGCNFPEVPAHEAGLVADATPAGIERGLETLLAASDGELERMGARGRALVEGHYTWDQTARKLTTLYTWLRGGGPPPPFVELR